MIKSLTYMALLFCSATTFSQTIDDYVEEIGWGEFSTQYNYDRPAPEVKGEYYLFHDWTIADLNLYDGTKYKGKRLNLNLLSGDVEIPNGTHARILDKFKIKSIVVGDREFVNGLHLRGSTHKNAFFEVLEAGAVNVYCRYYAVMSQPRYGVPGSGNDRNYNVMIRQSYFVQSGGEMEMFTNKKKGNIRFFQASPLTVDYINEGRIRIKNIKGFLRAARFYNEQMN